MKYKFYNHIHKNNKTKLIIILLLVLLFLIVLNTLNNYIIADGFNGEINIENELNENTENILNTFNFNEFDNIVNDLNSSILGNKSFVSIITDIVNGNYVFEYNNIFTDIKYILIDNISSIIPLIIMILAIGILSQIVENFKNSSNNGVSEIISFVCFSAVVVLIIVQFYNVFSLTEKVINSIKTQIELVMPILLTLLTSLGSVISAGVYKPITLILSTGITLIFSNFIYPLFVLSFLFVVVGSISKTVKLNKFNDLINSTIKWSIGFIFTLFSAIITIQGISVSKYDSVSITATRFTLKSYIPIIGGYLSEGLDFVLLGSVLIKNAIGFVGLIILLLTILSPIIQILILKFGYQLIGSLIEPIGDSKIGKFVTDCSKILIYPILIILAVTFMYMLSVILIMITANIV